MARIPPVASRHDTTRYVAHTFLHREKYSDVLCRACRTARRDTLVTTGATRTTHVQERRHSVDWGGHVHLTFFPEVGPGIHANPEHKRLNLYTRVLLLLRRLPC